MVGVTVEGISSDCAVSHRDVMLRPRGTLARTLYNKYLSDEHLETLDKIEWYRVDVQSLSPSIAQLYLPLRPDEGTDEFLENSRRLSNSVFTQIYHSLVKFILGFFMTHTSINGWLGRGSMFVFSKLQFRDLVDRSEGQSGDLIDLGAGDGTMTRTMAPFFTRVTVTELSKPMRSVLSGLGFRVAEVDTWFDNKYDVISCLNLLDRCDRPRTMLGQIRAGMKTDSLVVLAIVLPFKPYVETGTNNHKPAEELQVRGSSFEEQTTSFITDVLEPAGFQVLRWTRLPYLCQGDLNQAYYWLHDAVFVVKLAE